MTPESALKKKINAYLNSVPGLFHFPVMNRGYGKNGVPDRVLCYKGRFVGIEVKAPGGTASTPQQARIAEIVEAGGIAEVVWSVENVREIIESL